MNRLLSLLLAIDLAVVGAVAIAFVLGAVHKSALIPTVAVGVALALIILAIWGLLEQRRRTLARHAALRALGLSLTVKPDKSRAPALFAPFAHIKELRHGAKRLTWHAAGHVEGRPVEVIEHLYMVSTGKSTHAVIHTAAGVPCPPAWPDVVLRPENVLHRLGEFLGLHDIRLDDESFNRRWRVKAKDQDFVILALPPAVQEWLTGAHKSESWIIGSGRICCVRHGRVGPGDMADFIARPGRLLAMLPPELEAWAPASAKRTG